MSFKGEILVVDDDADVLDLVTGILQHAGYKAAGASDGAEGLALIKNGNFDVAILDMMMPRMDGMTALAEIKKTASDVEVIMFTAHSSVDTAVESMRLGAFDYVKKPFETEVLLATVEKAMTAHRVAALVRGAFRVSGKDALAEIILDSASRLLCGDETFLLLAEEGEEPRLAGSSGLMDETAGKARLEFCARCLRLLEESKDKALALAPATDSRFRGLPGAADTAAALCVPLEGNGRLTGVLCAVRLTPGAQFGEAELRKAKDFGPVASLALKNALLGELLQTTRTQLVRTQKMEAVGMMVSQVTHDFNNLLTVIINSAQLQLENPDSDIGQNLSREILRMAREAATFIQQLLLFTHHEAASAVPIDLNAATAEITFIVEKLPGRNIKTVYIPAPDLPKVRIKPEHFKQVALNLAINARNAMPEGGKMTIRTLKTAADVEAAGSRPAEYAVLEVSDTGPGIDQENLKKIFEPFFTTKPAGKGTGLGLHIVQTIVNQYGGKITVESPPGGGALFRVYFPAAEV